MDHFFTCKEASREEAVKYGEPLGSLPHRRHVSDVRVAGQVQAQAASKQGLHTQREDSIQCNYLFHTGHDKCYCFHVFYIIKKL